MKSLTSIRLQQRYQVRLIFGENSDERLEVTDTSACEKLEQLVIPITLHGENMLSLWPRDKSDIRASKLTDERLIRLNEIHQMDTIVIQRPHPSVV